MPELRQDTECILIAKKQTVKSKKSAYCFTKRCIDLFFSLLAMPIYLILYTLVAVVVKFTDGGPVLYKSVRIGKDGKPFKTREGGVMRLEVLLSEINEEMYHKIRDNQNMTDEEARKTAKIVALSAVKYGDLSNQASKDYIFDIERFTSFEGNTGPYILYTIVRIKSILNKYKDAGKSADGVKILPPHSEDEKALMLEISRFNAMMENAFEETAPHKVCAYIYDVANAFNHFYHNTKIMAEEDVTLQASYIRLLELTKRVLETCIDVLGFSAPDKM